MTILSIRSSGTLIFLEIDDQVTIEDLLKGIIVQSGNDASIALAECLSGTEVDFAKEGINEGFKFNNPNVKDTCGCGESFNV